MKRLGSSIFHEGLIAYLLRNCDFSMGWGSESPIITLDLRIEVVT